MAIYKYNSERKLKAASEIIEDLNLKFFDFKTAIDKARNHLQELENALLDFEAENKDKLIG